MGSKLALDPNAIYSRSEAAHLLGVGLTTLKQMIRSGHLLVSRPEGIRRVFIKGSSILTMLDRTMLIPEGISDTSFKKSLHGEQSALASRYPVQLAPILKSAASSNAYWRGNGQSRTLALRNKERTHARRGGSR